MKIGIKNYKSCAGNEGDAFSCTLYLDGKRVATIQYDGWGGEYVFDFELSDKTMYGGPVCTRFKEYVESLPKKKTDIADGDDPSGFWHMQPSMDSVVEPAIKAVVQKKMCQGKVMFQLESDRKCAWQGFRGKWKGNEDMWRKEIADYAKEEGTTVRVILNERLAA